MNPPEPERVFDEPWQAQAFALTVELHKRGQFTWTEWAAALSSALAHDDDYYTAWQAALETLTVAKGLVDTPALATRKADWAEAYEHTPHGRPVELGARG